MESGVFNYIYAHSRNKQVILLLLTGISFPFLYASLDIPKIIINDAIGGVDFPRTYFGVYLEQFHLKKGLVFIFIHPTKKRCVLQMEFCNNYNNSVNSAGKD